MTSDKFDLDDLKSAVDAATPRPDPAARAAHMRLAEDNFEKLHQASQGTKDVFRPTSERQKTGVFAGVKDMLKAFSTKGGLAATTAMVALGFVVLTPQGQNLFRPGPVMPEPVEEDPVEVELGAEIPAINFNDPAPTARAVAPAAPTPEADGIGVTALPNAPLPQVVQDIAPGTFSASPTVGNVQVAPEAAVAGGITQAEAIRDPFIQRPDFTDVPAINREPDTEAFANEAPNPLKITSEEPVSTFSIDVDTASYSIIRQSLMAGALPPRDAVRIEEMINYFPYEYAAPDRDGDVPFQPSITVMDTPWNEGTQLVHIAIQGVMPDITERPPLNLVFLIDTSGSMDQPNKLPLLRQSFLMMLDELRPEDQVAIVAYAGSSGLVLDATSAADQAAITAALNSLRAGGSTNGQGGLQQAYTVAEAMTDEGEVSRVILATDGDFNVGLSGVDELENFIAKKRNTGTYLSVLGFGRGNLDDATMQVLAQNGNGVAAYIDTLNEAQKVLVDQLTGALFAIAGDVKIQVEFNPGVIAEYRLIGYETRALAREDFNNDQVDAGELGAGHTVTAIYEVTPVGSDAILNDPLRYGSDTVASDSSEIGFLRLRWKAPGEDESQLIETPILMADGITEINQEAQFATAIAGFGQLLRGDSYLGDWGWNEAITLANASRGDDPFGYRTEAVQLMRLAESLSQN